MDVGSMTVTHLFRFMYATQSLSSHSSALGRAILTVLIVALMWYATHRFLWPGQALNELVRSSAK